MEALTKLMLGGLPTGRIGGLLHCRLRYFDPARHRAGIPEDVAALVSHMDAESVSVVLGERDAICHLDSTERVVSLTGAGVGQST